MTARDRRKGAGKPQADAAGKQYETLTLEARVIRPRRTQGPGRCNQREAARLLSVTTETIRSFVAHGLPEYGKPGQPQYDRGELVRWYRYWCHLQTVKERRGRRSQERVGRVTMAAAERWNLMRNAEEDPEWYVVIPLDWDAGQRAALLRIAAEGRDPLTDTRAYPVEDDV